MDLSLRSLFTNACPEADDRDAQKLQQDLSSKVLQALADDLQLFFYACFPASPGQDPRPSWRRSQVRYLACQLIGALSLLGFHGILDNLLDFTIAEAAKAKGISLPEPIAPVANPAPSSWAMANADELARNFGLLFDNQDFTRALEAGRISDGGPLASLGVPVLVDQVARVSAKTILANPAAPVAGSEQERIPQPENVQAAGARRAGRPTRPARPHSRRPRCAKQGRRLRVLPAGAAVAVVPRKVVVLPEIMLHLSRRGVVAWTPRNRSAATWEASMLCWSALRGMRCGG